MNNRLIISLLMVPLALVLLTGCQKVTEPWDSADYFKEERTRTPEQQKALQHRLASIQETREKQPWLHAAH